MKLSDLGSYEVQTPRQQGFSIDQRNRKASDLESSQVALSNSQQMMDSLMTQAKQLSPMGVLTGAAKEIGSTVKGLGGTAVDAGKAMLGPLNAIPGVSEGIDNAKTSFQNALGLTDENLQTNTPSEQLGKGLMMAAELAVPIGGGAKTAVKEAPGLLTRIGQFVRGKIGGLTKEEILAVSPEKVSSLSARERQIFFDEQRKIADKTFAEQEKALIKKTADTHAALDAEAQDLLTKQLPRATTEETVALRPKILSAMGRQSSEYRSLVDKAMEGVKDTPVDSTELQQFIVSKLPDNPEYAMNLASKMGLKAGDTQGTVGSIYSKMKSMRGDMAAAAKKGARAFTADEKATDDAISMLSDFLKTKGVDLKEANSFWAKYAPVRNQLITEAKPFNQAGTMTQAFDRRLQRFAQGTDVSNEAYMKQVEDLIGEPLGKEAKALVEKLDANAKAKLSAKMAEDFAKEDLKIQRELDLNRISDAKAEAERKALMRKIFYGVIAGGVALKANEKLKENTGIGIPTPF